MNEVGASDGTKRGETEREEKRMWRAREGRRYRQTLRKTMGQKEETWKDRVGEMKRKD